MAILTKKLDLNPRFRHALQLMEHTTQSLFITGRAGTGKSTLLAHFCARTTKNPVVIAPTGVAALNVGGVTIHKFFGFYIDVTPEKIRALKVRPRNPKLYTKLKTIIIDEVSMVRADLLDCIDEFLRLYGPEKHQPFGGVQMIFVGDLYQLPPVVNRDAEALFNERYETPYFFSARCLKSADFSVIELDTIYRQKEQQFVELLNRIRTDDANEADITLLNTRLNPTYKPSKKSFFIHLTTTNRKADEINAEHLNALSAKLHTTNAVITGEFGKEYYPTATELQFKLGSQIMLINNDTQGRWVNGSIGVIEQIRRDDEDRACVDIRLEEERDTVTVYPHQWEVFHYTLDGGEIHAEPVGTFTQFPFRLAWAVTIHKSQGKTFDHVVIDIDRGTFAAGQMYVALSRCTTFEGIVLKTRVARNHISTDPRIVEFLAAHPYTPEAATLPADDSMLQETTPDRQKPDRMTGNRARRIFEQLAAGIDPTTGTPLPENTLYQSPLIREALNFALTMRDPRATTRRQAKPGAINHGKPWTQEERTRVANAYNQNQPLKQIATTHGRTQSSIRGELIKQGLISLDDEYPPEPERFDEPMSA